MPYYLSPFNEQQVDANGNPLVGGKVYTYLAGTSTPAATYTDSTSGTPQANPIILNSLGLPNSPIWMVGGQPLKFVFKDSSDVLIRTVDNVSGINDTGTISVSEWVSFAGVPTYISATSFSLTGDQRLTFQVNRRIQSTNTGGTIYSTISASSYAAGVTTVTVVNDSGVLDAGLSAVNYALLGATNPSVSTAVTQPASDNSTKIATTAFVQSTVIQRSYLAGLTMSTAGSSSTLTVAAGQAMDSTNAASMSLSSATSKTTSAWSVGSGVGGLDTGAIASSTWYYFYLIRRPDTGVVDVVFSLSSSAPTLPTNYTQYRYIGAALTNGSSQWTKFYQKGDRFFWDSPTLDINAAFPSTARQTSTINAPRGRKYLVTGNAVISTTSGSALYISDPDSADLAPSNTVAPLVSVTTSSAIGVTPAGQVSVMTNTSAQICWRGSAVSGSFLWSTTGWEDPRGKDL